MRGLLDLEPLNAPVSACAPAGLSVHAGFHFPQSLMRSYLDFEKPVAELEGQGRGAPGAR